MSGVGDQSQQTLLPGSSIFLPSFLGSADPRLTNSIRQRLVLRIKRFAYFCLVLVQVWPMSLSRLGGDRYGTEESMVNESDEMKRCVELHGFPPV